MEARVPFTGKLSLAGRTGKGGHRLRLHPSYRPGRLAFPFVPGGPDMPRLSAPVACRQLIRLFHQRHLFLHRVPCRRLRYGPAPLQFLYTPFQFLLLRVVCTGNVKVVQCPVDVAVGIHRGAWRTLRHVRVSRQVYRSGRRFRQTYRVPLPTVEQRGHLLECPPPLFLFPHKLLFLVGVHLALPHLPVFR